MNSLPLGIDIGTTAVRIVSCAPDNGTIRLQRVVRFRNPVTDPVALGKTIAAELAAHDIRERRCVMVMQDPDACMRTLELPAMTKRELHAVAQLEADRHYGEAQGIARVSALKSSRTTVVGLARRRVVENFQSVAKSAKLKLIALDHAAYAYARLFPRADAIADIGLQQTRFFALRGSAPWSTTIDIAGQAMTTAIARAYSIDLETAERRKLERPNTAGGAELELDALVEGIGRAIRTARLNGSGEIESLLLVGNGARIATLVGRLERHTGCLVEIATRQPFTVGPYGVDVVGAALPDWALALGALAWSVPEERAA